MKSYSYKKNKKTRKIRTSGNYNYIENKYTQERIVLTFLQMLNTIKLYHWKTHNYAQHKATDELYSKLNEYIDTFVETMLGKKGNRVNLTKVKCLPLYDYNNLASFKEKINQYRTFLINMTYDANLNLTNNSDLLNIRDEILGNINQFEYLLTLR